MIEVKSKIASELYDIIMHCRNDTFENFYEDLLTLLNDESERETR